MARADRPLPRIAVTLSALACAAMFAACPLAADGEKKPGNSTLVFSDAESLCTDGVNLYLTEANPAPDGTVKAVDLSIPKGTTVAQGLDHPTCILADNEHLYWIEDNAAPSGAVRRSGKDGSDPVALASGLDSPTAIAINGTDVFFADKRGGGTAISRVPRAGGEATVLATLAFSVATMLVADDAYVYFTAPYDAPNGYIGRIPVGGGGPEPVITGLGTPNSLAISGNRLCFTEFQGGEVGCVEDRAASWTPAFLATGEGVNFGRCPGQLLIDAGTVYFAISAKATQDAVRMVIPGYAPVTVATTGSFGTIQGMVVLGSNLYWLESDAIYRVAKSY